MIEWEDLKKSSLEGYIYRDFLEYSDKCKSMNKQEFPNSKGQTKRTNYINPQLYK